MASDHMPSRPVIAPEIGPLGPLSAQPMVSIIVATKNEEKNIAACLGSLKAQTYRNIEIVVVDAHSPDATADIARQYTSKVFLQERGLATQRNRGIKEVSDDSRFCMFIDADMILAPGLVESCVRATEDRSCAALFIPEIVLGAGFWSRVRRFERRFYDGTAIDGARLYRRDAIERVGGFDENPKVVNSVEDWDFDQKIKRVGRIDLLAERPGRPCADWELAPFIKNRGVDPARYGAVIYHNESDFDLRKYLHKKSYYAGTFDVYICKWGRENPDVARQFGFRYRYFGVFLENGKWRRLLSHPLLASGMYFLRFLVGMVFLTRNLIRAKDRPR